MAPDSGWGPPCPALTAVSRQVVTAGRDFQCCVWQRDQLVLRLRWDENMPGVPDKTYRYQACR